jgi:23S rRNA (cytosine1962-C5)-methyltransferase
MVGLALLGGKQRFPAARFRRKVSPMATAILKAGRERSLLRRHPWVFSGAIARLEEAPASGETVELHAADGRVLGRGAYSPRSQIAVRVWTFDPDEEVGSDLLRTRLARAIAARAALPTTWRSSAARLVNAESDGLPGLVVDRYDRFLVCQLLSAGPERLRAELVALLGELVPCDGIYERSDVEVRAKEGREPRAGLLVGEAPPELLEIEEGPCRYLVDLRAGHKTGFYLDQRESRARLAAYAPGREVLNAFAYTGSFGIVALAHGATRVTNVERSAAALELGRRNLALNGLAPNSVEEIEGDVFKQLRRFRDARREFDLVTLDPPKFAESRAQLERAARGYKDINLLAFKLLRPGGLLLTFSCSGLVVPELFQKIVADAALDAGREATILERLGLPADHPTALAFPEGSYLKGLVCRVA